MTQAPSQSREFNEQKTALHRAIFMRESRQAARAYEDLTGRDPDFLLPPNLQYDFARLMELGNEPRLALRAYEQILTEYQDHKSFGPSLKGAGHLSYRLKQYKKCRTYLEKFLNASPSQAERADAEHLLRRLPDGKGIRDATTERFAPAADTAADSASGIDLSSGEQAFVESQPDEEKSGISISLDIQSEELENLEKQFATSTGVPPTARILKTPPQQQQQAHQPPKPSSSTEVEISEATRSTDLFNMPSQEVRLPPASEESAEQTVDLFDVPPAQRSEQPDYDSLANFDQQGQTPPLSVASRDVLFKQVEMAKVDEPADARDQADATVGWGAAVSPSSAASINDMKTPKPVNDPYDAPPAAANTRLRLEKAQFAMLLPLGEKIKMDRVARLLVRLEGIPLEQAREAIIERKGLLTERLTFQEVSEIGPMLRELDISLRFIATESYLIPDFRHDVTAVDILEPGLRFRTNKGVKKARWDQIYMVSAGRLDRQPTIDLFCHQTCQLFRMREGAFDFHSVVDTPREDQNQSAKAFLKWLVPRCPNVVTTRTVDKLLRDEAYRPQKFGSEDEFRRYNRLHYFTHFGQEYNP